MISETELAKLSYPEAPKMVTSEVPGPETQKALARSFQSESCARGAGRFPIVYAGTGKPAPAVATDNATGIRQAVMHLRDHGHQRIAYIAGYENVIGDSSIRLDAYKAAIREFGLEFKPELIAYGYHTIQGGELAMQKLLDSGHSFSAVLTSDYSSALGVVRILEETGHRIPEDIALIGFERGSV
mgnify:CR=1 FL=1